MSAHVERPSDPCPPTVAKPVTPKGEVPKVGELPETIVAPVRVPAAPPVSPLAAQIKRGTAVRRALRAGRPDERERLLDALFTAVDLAVESYGRVYSPEWSALDRLTTAWNAVTDFDRRHGEGAFLAVVLAELEEAAAAGPGPASPFTVARAATVRVEGDVPVLVLVGAACQGFAFALRPDALRAIAAQASALAPTVQQDGGRRCP